LREKRKEKAKVAMVEEPEGLAIPEGKITTGRYTLNIASFRDKVNAERLMKELEDKGYEAFVEKANIPGKGTWYRVAVGRFSSRGEALAFARGLKEKGVTYSFVRKIPEVKR
jgi:DedD protein